MGRPAPGRDAHRRQQGPLAHARRREARQQRLVDRLLADRERVVVDNTNAAPEDRASLVAAARRAGVPVRAVWMSTPLEVCLERNLARHGRTRVPLPGLLGTRRRLVPPDRDEGFDSVEVVPGDR